MNFHRAELDEQDRANRTLGRWDSEDGCWRVQMDAVLYGVRCHVGRVHELRSAIPGWELVYCCGLQPVALSIVPALVMRALEQFDEGDDVVRIRAAFPEQRVKPMYNDPACWRGLCELAGVPELAGLLEINPKEPSWATE